MKLATIEAGIEAFARGEFVLVVDNADRENEGDLIVAAEKVTSEQMAFMVRHTSGLICLPDRYDDGGARGDERNAASLHTGAGQHSRRGGDRRGLVMFATPLPRGMLRLLAFALGPLGLAFGLFGVGASWWLRDHGGPLDDRLR